MRYYYAAEFPSVTKEWFPSFNKFLFEDYLEKNFEIEKLTHFKEDANFKVCKIPNTDQILHVHGNLSFFIDTKLKKAVGLTTHWNSREILSHNLDFITNYDVTIYNGHYFEKDINNSTTDIDKKYKIKPWSFRPLYWNPIEHRYNPKNEKAYFKGKFIPFSRNFLEIIQETNNDEFIINFKNVLYNDWLKESSESLLCISAPGVRDMCNRDIEFFQMGIPLIRPKFYSELEVKIPDEIYIPIDFEPITDHRPYGMPKDHQKLADEVVYTWNNIKNDREFLNKKSKLCREFYEEYYTNDKLVENGFKTIINEFNN